ncbi:hypothetical protein [Kitasatospora sp. NPDC059599]|uniref:hypothetical protein n=1 Tax=Kitasatospora sp. NPDC059599 TaxID=3346880 RepID=UPI0036CA1F36
MTPPAEFPPKGDMAAAREWLRERRNATIHGGPDEQQSSRMTHRELLARQWNALQAAAGFESQSSPREQQKRRRLDVALEGGQVEGHEAPIGLLGTFFSSLQETVTSVAQALTGAPTAASSIPGHIRNATLLRSSAAFPSSYGVHLYGPAPIPPEDLQDGLFEPPANAPSSISLLDESMATIFDIADTAQAASSEIDGPADEQLADRVVALGQRAVKHLSELSGLLAKAGVGLRFSWEPETNHSRSCTLDAHGAARLKRLSDGVEFGETSIESVEGKLVEANMRRGAVEIETNLGQLVVARTDELVTPRLGDNMLGKRVVAQAIVTTVRYATGRERRIYTLTSLHQADPQPS